MSTVNIVAKDYLEIELQEACVNNRSQHYSNTCLYKETLW